MSGEGGVYPALTTCEKILARTSLVWWAWGPTVFWGSLVIMVELRYVVLSSQLWSVSMGFWDQPGYLGVMLGQPARTLQLGSCEVVNWLLCWIEYVIENDGFNCWRSSWLGTTNGRGKWACVEDWHVGEFNQTIHLTFRSHFTSLISRRGETADQLVSFSSCPS